MPPGDIRGFDVRSGELKWTFHAAAQKGEFGAETWENDSAKVTGNANIWTMMSADETLGYFYLPFGTPANDYYGGERHGNGLFGEALVCLDARTGKRVWHFQMVHHGVWDYDLPAAPNLIDITVTGKKIKAVAQVSKQGFCYVFDRVTGKPIWPIEERPVPQSIVPGEKTSATQPFPTKPAPFDRQGMTKEDVIDFTPELHQEALKVLEKYNYGPLFTPPMLNKLTINMPGVAGGANWAGAASDPETGMLYIPSNTLPFAISLYKSPVPHTQYVAGFVPLPTVQGLPLYKPPYGRLTAIDLNTGDHKWMKPIGRYAEVENHPLLKSLNLPPPGRASRGHVLLTKTLLLVAQEGVTQRVSSAPDGFAMAAEFGIIDPKLRAHDKKTGEIIGEIELPRNATGAPMTYSVSGKQFIIIPTGGANLPPELIALSLP
jgi:quinoprotein glucose dehydrogenase